MVHNVNRESLTRHLYDALVIGCVFHLATQGTFFGTEKLPCV